MSGVRQVALALLTLSREGCRSLDGPQNNMPSNGGREGGEETGGEDRNKHKEKQWKNRKKFLKESLVRFPTS